MMKITARQCCHSRVTIPVKETLPGRPTLFLLLLLSARLLEMSDPAAELALGFGMLAVLCVVSFVTTAVTDCVGSSRSTARWA